MALYEGSSRKNATGLFSQNCAILEQIWAYVEKLEVFCNISCKKVFFYLSPSFFQGPPKLTLCATIGKNADFPNFFQVSYDLAHLFMNLQ